ncbi:Kinesin-like protein kif13b [Allomyces arbusculus]|nr:Kinesin-like protein kif13b [Allomyces arbusculus]
MGNTESASTPVDNGSSAQLPALEPAVVAKHCSEYDLTPAEILFAYQAHAALVQAALADQDGLLARACELLFNVEHISFVQYLKMIQWWHTSPQMSKLQYVFNFLDWDNDDFVTPKDLMTVLPKLLGSRSFQVDADVCITTTGHRGVVRYVGPTSKGAGDWLGIELHAPVGNSTGALKGKQYFSCPPKHGTFVQPAKCIEWSTIEWIAAIFEQLQGQPDVVKLSEDGFTIPRTGSVRIGWDQFAQVTSADPAVTKRLVRWFFPLPLRMGEPLPVAMARAASPAGTVPLTAADVDSAAGAGVERGPVATG